MSDEGQALQSHIVAKQDATTSSATPSPSHKTRQRRSQLVPNCRSIANKAPHSAPLRHFTICIAATSVLLRGLVQHVPSTSLRTGLSLLSLLLGCLRNLITPT